MGSPGAAVAARLKVAEDHAVGPADLAQVPSMDSGETSIELAQTLGVQDARSDAVDEFVVKPQFPHETFLSYVATVAPSALGARAYATLDAYLSGTLGQVAPQPVKKKPFTWVSGLALLAVIAATIFEVNIGQAMWMRMLNGETWTAFAASLTMTTIIVIGSLAAVGAAHTNAPGLLRAYGLRILTGWALLLVVTALLLGWVLGMGRARPTTGGISGGTTAKAPTAVSDPANWLLMAAYTLVLLLFATVVMAAHFLDRHHVDRIYVNAYRNEHARARKASLTGQALLDHAITLLTAHLVLAEQMTTRPRTITSAYTAAIRSNISPQINTQWDSTHLDKLPHHPLPAWTNEIRTVITTLQN